MTRERYEGAAQVGEEESLLEIAVCFCTMNGRKMSEEESFNKCSKI